MENFLNSNELQKITVDVDIGLQLVNYMCEEKYVIVDILNKNKEKICDIGGFPKDLKKELNHVSKENQVSIHLPFIITCDFEMIYNIFKDLPEEDKRRLTANTSNE